MKKIFFILLCFMVVFAAFAIDMSPQPGDTLETVIYVQGDVVAMSQAVSAPTLENVLHFEQSILYNQICVSAEANDKDMNPYYLLDSLSAIDAVAVAYTGFEVENDKFYTITGDVTIYHMDYG